MHTRLIKKIITIKPYIWFISIMFLLIVAGILDAMNQKLIALFTCVLPISAIYVGHPLLTTVYLDRATGHKESVRNLLHVNYFSCAIFAVLSVCTTYIFSDEFDNIKTHQDLYWEPVVNVIIISATLFPLVLMWLAASALVRSKERSRWQIGKKILILLAYFYFPIGVFFIRRMILKIIKERELEQAF